MKLIIKKIVREGLNDIEYYKIVYGLNYMEIKNNLKENETIDGFPRFEYDGETGELLEILNLEILN